jgi:hypothetical protein
LANKRSDKSPFESRFGGGWLSPGQYLAENMCARFATCQKTTLGVKFWRDKAWASRFRQQVDHANKLLKQFDIKAIIRALRTFHGQRVYSLGNPHLVPLIKAEQAKLVATPSDTDSQQAPPSPEATTQQPRPSFVPTTAPLSKLRDFDV